ncbi:DUF3576 domain-containing protein [Jannaschia aquimarina]|uniref:DUF3576 domain-containing protein n=1 Tax=Jannaschia aquimarina TaxID=935700 RepID=A0A0D1EGE0_9RHOB|nr:DUF3576 domain-containing protein [Jannaschia aquimarina]KIT16719.1 hypothetical protein jaqu_15070 [Jannaschia aquimarina]SNS54241.1 protein of unknown function [Jannaschia aquimarina]
MRAGAMFRVTGWVAAAALLAGCGGGDLFGQTNEERIANQENPRTIAREARANRRTSSVFDLFDNRDDPNVTLEVNKYLWAASLDVLSFLPVQAADPFSGVIQFGYGTPPGGGRAYQATVYVQDPALDARSLNVALRTRSGAVSRETQRAIEDAILTRARQLRIRDSRL